MSEKKNLHNMQKDICGVQMRGREKERKKQKCFFSFCSLAWNTILDSFSFCSDQHVPQHPSLLASLTPALLSSQPL